MDHLTAMQTSFWASTSVLSHAVTVSGQRYPLRHCDIGSSTLRHANMCSAALIRSSSDLAFRPSTSTTTPLLLHFLRRKGGAC
ncbi:hypothetical protein K466DRAFT_70690 [Polyporus arcularius HHB13444]|uniref:Uncharacterized protein n=1 Tax=Polyporus arcularius HHB13444 TaxID=1314778 RepID=A0A5C3PY35_9APHY|nr:hypothetical protein K466DRAFT_70690 [Polyporus arcularius HHB13444]